MNETSTPIERKKRRRIRAYIWHDRDRGGKATVEFGITLGTPLRMEWVERRKVRRMERRLRLAEREAR